MKKLILKNKAPLSFWLIIHVGSALLFFILPHGIIETDLITLVPSLSQDRSFEKPLKHFFSLSSHTVNLFVEAENFETAKKSAYQLEKVIRQLSDRVQVQLEIGGGDYHALLTFFDRHKYVLLPDTIVQRLEHDEASALAEEAIATIYSPFFISSFSTIETDPFLLVNSKLEDVLRILALQVPSLQMRDNLLYTTVEGKSALFMTFDIPDEFPDKDGQFQFMKRFLHAVDELSHSSAVSVYMSGVPVHSFYSQKSAQREMSIISTLSIIAAFFLFLFTYKSMKAFIVCMATLTLSTAFSYCMTSILFSSIHIFTFVFGTSVIGITMDYSIHYITHWYFGNTIQTITKKIFTSLFLSLLTTVTGYVALSFSSIELLRQVSVFSILGITSSFLTVVIVFPYIFKREPRNTNQHALVLSEAYVHTYLSFFTDRKKNVFLGAAVLVCLSLWGLRTIRTDFSVTGLYRVPDNLISQEKAVYERMGNREQTDLIIVKADSIDALVEKEEQLGHLFKNKPYLALSQFLPSVQKQRHAAALVQKTLLPLLEKQTETLGLDRHIFLKIREGMLHSQEHCVNLESLLDFSALSALKKLTFKDGNSYFSLIILPKKLDGQAKDSLERTCSGVKVFSVIPAINEALKKTAHEAVLLTIGAYLVIFFIAILCLYKKQALVIIAIQLFCLLLNAGIHGLFHIPVNIFSIPALILSIGISIDYFIFFSHADSVKALTFIAVFLSMLTTVLSFGTLSLSTFIPVRSFSLSLFIGIVCAFAFAPIVMLVSKNAQKSQ